MPKASPIKNVFEGEFSELAQGRTDLERYPRSMRSMLNFVSAKQGPAIRRSGTRFMTPVMDETKKGRLIPFVFNEREAFQLEFSHLKLRFIWQYEGIQTNREALITSVLQQNPMKVQVANTTDYFVGAHVIFNGLADVGGVNRQVFTVTAFDATTITVNTNYEGTVPATPPVGATISIVYELDTPYSHDDLKYLRARQWLDVVYLFCKGYRTYKLKRRDLYDWKLVEHEYNDGPYLNINATNTKLVPDSGRGTWVPDMTGNTTPSGEASASSANVLNPAYKAFDGDPWSYWESVASQDAVLGYSFVSQTNAIPVMTGPTTGGVTMSAQSQSSGDEAWKARDGDSNTDWRSSGNVPQWVMVDFGSNKTIRTYSIRISRAKPEYSPRDWQFQGSASSGGPWTTLDTQSNKGWDDTKKRVIDISSPADFRFYRINVTAVNRETRTTKIPAQGKPGQPGYVPPKTVTTKTDPRAAIANIEMFETVGQPRVVDGYAIHIPRRNAEDKGAKAYAPLTWNFDGFDGENWILLDSQQDYNEWDNRKSKFFEIQNEMPYQAYRIWIREMAGSGTTVCRISNLVLSSPDAPLMNWSATSPDPINNGKGFLATDVGRSIRMLAEDNTWRWGVIESVTDITAIQVRMHGSDPLVFRRGTPVWRLGMWSDTTGWPIDGTFFEDRLWAGGAEGYPDTIASSVVGLYENWRGSSLKGVVTDTHGVTLRCQSRHLSRIRWISSDMQGLLVGTGTGEYVITTPDNEALTARNLKARIATRKGSASDIEPVTADEKVFNVQLTRRSLNVFTRDQYGNYANKSVSTLASHLAYPFVSQIVYGYEPHGMIWGRREDGSVIAMSYDDDSDMLGGHRHDFGGIVEDLSILPSVDDGQEILWMIIVRKVNGVDRRYVEYMTRYWDFGMTLNVDAHYLDSGLRYYGGTPQTVIKGLRHMTGENVDVIADGVAYRDIPVVAGAITLPNPATSILAGKRMRAEGEINNLEAGAADGTAQGKTKRPNYAVMRVWDTLGGYIGRYNEDQHVMEYVPIEYENYDNTLDTPALKTEQVGPVVLPTGYGKRGSVSFFTDDPYPFNVVAIYPQLNTQDR